MYKRGDILVANLGQSGGSEQGGQRFVVVISNNTGNKYAPTLIVASLTSQVKNMHLPTHVKLTPQSYSFLSKDSIILAEQIRTLDKSKVKANVDRLTDHDLERLDKALRVSIAI